MLPMTNTAVPSHFDCLVLLQFCHMDIPGSPGDPPVIWVFKTSRLKFPIARCPVDDVFSGPGPDRRG